MKRPALQSFMLSFLESLGDIQESGPWISPHFFLGEAHDALGPQSPQKVSVCARKYNALQCMYLFGFKLS